MGCRQYVEYTDAYRKPSLNQAVLMPSFPVGDTCLVLLNARPARCGCQLAIGRTVAVWLTDIGSGALFRLNARHAYWTAAVQADRLPSVIWYPAHQSFRSRHCVPFHWQEPRPPPPATSKQPFSCTRKMRTVTAAYWDLVLFRTCFGLFCGSRRRGER